MQREHVDEALEELERRLRLYPVDRYPIQHATAQFHKGVLLLQADQPERARGALETAISLFQPEKLPVEHAKATNMLGVAYRALGRPGQAAGCFESAADAFEAADLDLEEGAALFNLGLARREDGDPATAAATFRRARKLLDPERVPGQAGAAARELGVTLLNAGDPHEAVGLLREAVSLSGRADDEPGVGAASNALGLALIATDEYDAAVEALRDAVAADPRPLRPAAHAVAKSNLALAFEAAGRAARARLTALQAAAIPGAPEAAVRQAEAVLQRVATGGSAVMPVLEEEATEVWPRIFHEELVRWLDLAPETRVHEARLWLTAQTEKADDAEALAEAWLSALLELPPPDMERVITGALEAAGPLDAGIAEAWRHQTRRAMVRFPLPQWDRLRTTFDRVAQALGQEPAWT